LSQEIEQRLKQKDIDYIRLFANNLQRYMNEFEQQAQPKPNLIL